MSNLVQSLVEKGYLREDALIGAFATIGREEFIPDSLSHNANVDIPLPIGYGQSIPQPTVIAFALSLLDVQKGQNILEVGSGSGWVTALLAYLAGEQGQITALELIPDLYHLGKENIKKFTILEERNIKLYNRDGAEGYKKNAPYDRILVGIDFDEIPRNLKDQLSAKGKMVISLRGSIWFVEKRDTGLYTEEYRGFSFPPSVKKGEWKI